MIEKPLIMTLSGRIGPRWVAQPVGGAQHVAVGFISKLQEQIGFGTVRLGERELPVADGPGLGFSASRAYPTQHINAGSKHGWPGLVPD